MKSSRREFLKGAAVAVAAIPLAPVLSAAAPAKSASLREFECRLSALREHWTREIQRAARVDVEALLNG